MISSQVGKTPFGNCIQAARGTLDNASPGCSILQPGVSAVVWQRLCCTEKVTITAEKDTLLSVLHDVMGCDADGDPLQIVRRCIPRPRFRSL